MSQNVEVLLSQTLSPSPDIRVNAENVLKTLTQTQTFLPTLLALSTKSLPAAIYLKNHLRSYSSIPVESKDFLKCHILKIIREADEKCAKVLLNGVGIIIANDEWTSLIQEIGAMIGSGTLSTVRTGLLVLLELVKCWQWYQSKSRDQLRDQLMADGSTEAMGMLKSLIKVYSCGIRMELDEYLQRREILDGWISLLSRCILKKTVGSDEKSEEWKVKKWAFTSLNSLMGRGRRTDKRYIEFSRVFIGQYGVPLVQQYLSIVEGSVNGCYISSKVRYCILQFLGYAVRVKEMYRTMNGHLEVLLRVFVLPSLSFDEQELYLNDAEEYVKMTVEESFGTVKSGATELIELLVKFRFKESFQPIVQVVTEALESHRDELKYAALVIISTLKDVIPNSADMTHFLQSQVSPLVTSSSGFLRYKSLDILSLYHESIQPDQLVPVILALLVDPDLVVRVSACLSVSTLLKYPLKLNDKVVTIMHILLQTTNEINLDTLSPVIESLVFQYSEELKPYSCQFATQLVGTFMNVMASESEDINNVESTTLTAMGLLKTLDSLVLSLDGNLDILHGVESVIIPLISYILTQSILDIYEETFELINTLLFTTKCVSPLIQSILPLIYHTFNVEGVEYFHEMLPCLVKVVLYGQCDIEMMMNLVFKAMQDESKSSKVRGSILLNTLILSDQFRDEYIQPIITLCQSNMNCKNTLKIHLLNIIISLIYKAPLKTIQILEHLQFTSTFFTLWLQSLEKLKRVYDKKISILALTKLLVQSEVDLPLILQQVWVFWFDAILSLLNTYPDAVKGRERLEVETEEGDDDDDEYLNGDDDEDEYDVGDEKDTEETLEVLINNAAAHSVEYQQQLEEEEDSDDDEEWDVEEYLQEDLAFQTNVDQINVYSEFRNLIALLERDGRAQVLDGRLSEEAKNSLRIVLALPIA